MPDFWSHIIGGELIVQELEDKKWKKGYLVLSGFGHEKHMHWIIPEKSSKRLSFEEGVRGAGWFWGGVSCFLGFVESWLLSKSGMPGICFKLLASSCRFSSCSFLDRANKGLSSLLFGGILSSTW